MLLLALLAEVTNYQGGLLVVLAASHGEWRRMEQWCYGPNRHSQALESIPGPVLGAERQPCYAGSVSRSL